MKFGLIARAYAPFKTFGLCFHGDARGPTARAGVTSRVKAWVAFDPTTGVIETAHAKSDSSSLTFLPDYHRTATPSASVHGSAIGKNTVHLHMHVSGANPFLPPAPPIDMRVIVTACVGSGFLHVNGSLSGDAFPNVEVIVQDEGGGRRLLAVFDTFYGPEEGPFVRLWGNRNANMFGLCKSFPLNAQGRFA